MATRKRTALEPATRVTRSSARLAAARSDDAKLELPKAKKPKRTAASKSPTPDADREEGPVGVLAEKPKKGKGRGEKPSAVAAEDGEAEGKTVVIEHCKQCNSFKTRALKVKEGLEAAVAGVKVVVNPEKPRKGCFEIREEDGETFVSLLDMKRPFKAMKDLDMDEVITGIIDKIK
ncbi:hypothetical protein DM860_011668 [Cuscuta australis]|uniref:Selenoprotein H n=1 Tax=Cuscuta australis TaxID=267555 RepID=A0A328DJP6_9ASTE|nr:hypothetical protein DM860_011668 [Cuscuta australis]